MQPIIAEIVSLHAEEAASLYQIRSAVVRAPHLRLADLRRAFDDRIAAHLDGLAVAGEYAWPPCEAALEAPSAGVVFTAAVRALEEKNQERLDRLFALSAAVPQTRSGLVSAFGWLERERLQGIGVRLLRSPDPLKCIVGLAACSMHRVDPGLVSAQRLLVGSPSVRARALRTAGEIGCQEAVPACAAAMNDDDPDCRVWAAWSSVLMGNRGIPLEALTNTGLNPGPHRFRAFRLALQAMSPSASHRVLRELAGDPAQLRWLLQGTGIAGDSVYVPWVIKHMRDDTTARLAGEAFTFITSADLPALDLERPEPDGFESGPNDNPDDENVEMDPDEGLPWPNVQKVEEWWAANSHRFQPGQRYFMGAPVTRDHCIEVLKHGYQRQRILAAHYLCLLNPGTPLFNTSAPAWRQQRLLAKM